MKGCVCTNPLGKFREPNRFTCSVRTRPGHHLETSRGGIDHRRNDFLMLIMREGRRFAGGAHRSQNRCALGNVPLDKLFQSVVIDLARGMEWSDQGYGQSGKAMSFSRGRHGLDHSLGWVWVDVDSGFLSKS